MNPVWRGRRLCARGSVACQAWEEDYVVSYASDAARGVCEVTGVPCAKHSLIDAEPSTLVSVGSDLDIRVNASLTEVSLPMLEKSASGFVVMSNALTEISAPMLGRSITCTIMKTSSCETMTR